MNQPKYDYYLQPGKAPSLRRYPPGCESGERWHEQEGQWTRKCAPRASCVLTHDPIISEAEAAIMFPGSVEQRPAPVSAGARTEGGAA